MKAYVFPGQGAQFVGMGKDLYEQSSAAARLFDRADTILGFPISEVMFGGTADELKQTRVTQPAVFLHSVASAVVMGDEFCPDMVAGHSLGEFSALVASGALDFDDGLRLVSKRAEAMQRACQTTPSTMAAVISSDWELIERVCESIDDVVVPANYNAPSQLVISGSEQGVARAMEALTAAGVRKIVKLNVGGAFHSPLMAPAREELQHAIETTPFRTPRCPIYQNVDAMPHTDPDEIRRNLMLQLTAAVKWRQSVERMIADGADNFVELGPGEVLCGLVRKINPDVTAVKGL